MKTILFILAIGCSIIVFQTAYGEDVTLDSPDVNNVKAEKHKLTTTPARNYTGDTVLRRLYTRWPNISIPPAGALCPKSVIVSKQGLVLKPGKDYALDPQWGTLWIPKGSTLTPEDTVSVDYSYTVLRVDSKIVNADGKTIIRKGRGHLTTPAMPILEPGEKRICNYLIGYDGSIETFPIRSNQPDLRQTTGPESLPHVMEKLRRGENVTIVCWGDSVTSGGDASRLENRYASVFEKMLRDKFPKASIQVIVISVGGSNSKNWLYPDKFPCGQRTKECNFQRIVEAKPDVVTVEFVNDSYMTGDQVQETYSEILCKLRKMGAEVIFITPHFTCPGMMLNFKDGRYRECRPYVKALKIFSIENKTGLADVSARWEQLADEGIPYMTLLQNAINHPDDRGHMLFAEELLRCFTPRQEINK